MAAPPEVNNGRVSTVMFVEQTMPAPGMWPSRKRQRRSRDEWTSQTQDELRELLQETSLQVLAEEDAGVWAEVDDGPVFAEFIVSALDPALTLLQVSLLWDTGGEVRPLAMALEVAACCAEDSLQLSSSFTLEPGLTSTLCSQPVSTSASTVPGYWAGRIPHSCRPWICRKPARFASTTPSCSTVP